MTPPPISGYVLAGGRSSRMGSDKAMLTLAGKPLIAHAVTKLSRICGSVHVLSANPRLAPYGPLVPDLHPDCGPIGGIEAALAHSQHDWNFILPVDIPFLPTAFLDRWARETIAAAPDGLRISLFTISGVPQPTLLMLHREASPHIAQAVARGDFKLFPALEAAGRELAARHSLTLGNVLHNANWDQSSTLTTYSDPDTRYAWQTITPSQQTAQPLWFANLNTPGDVAAAQLHLDALDT